jgi:hypothetical protein
LALRQVTLSFANEFTDDLDSIGGIRELWFLVSELGSSWYNADEIVSFRVALEPGAMGRFLGLLVAITPAAFSVSGVELIAM